MKNDIKCKYCGRIYSSPSEMRKRKCHSHPKGAWCGYCTPNVADEFAWGVYKRAEESREREREEAALQSKFAFEYKKHTPLLDCVLKRDYDDEPSKYHLQIRNSDLNDIAIEFANGINSKTRDAINTVYALREGCDFVLTNAEAQKEGSLSSWLDEIKLLKEEVVSWDFWVSLYWLTKPIKDQSEAVGYDDFENDRKKWDYWHVNSIAKLFHTRYVIAMLHAVNNKGDEREVEVRNAIKCRIEKLRAEKSAQKDFDPGQIRCIDALRKRIDDYTFWGVLYCLYWIALRPTAWNDKKVWPIQVSQKENSGNISCVDFAKKLRDAYSGNYSPFKKLWIYNKTTLVFDEYKSDFTKSKTVAIDVAVGPEAVNVTLFMRDGNLKDVQSFASDCLKKLFPEIVAQRLRHSKIPYTEVPAFIDKVLKGVREMW